MKLVSLARRSFLTASLILFLGLAAAIPAQDTAKPPQRNKPPAAGNNDKKNEEPAVNPRLGQHVIVISIEGMLPDSYTNPASLHIDAPQITTMKLNGAVALGVEGVYPCSAHPCYAALSTGASPAVNGVGLDVTTANRQALGLEAGPPNQAGSAATGTASTPSPAQDGMGHDALAAEPIWISARKAGLSTAAIGWPFTSGAEVDYGSPGPGAPALTDPRPIVSESNGSASIDGGGPQVTPEGSDEHSVSAAEDVIKRNRPNLVLIHLGEMDQAERRFGPGSAQAAGAMHREDGYVARIVGAIRDAGIFEKTTIFIVSAHGEAEIESRFAPNVVLVKAKLITLGSEGRVASWRAIALPDGGSCAIVLRDPADKAASELAFGLFSQVMLRARSPLYRVLDRKALDKLEAAPQAALMLDAASGYYFDGALQGPEIAAAPRNVKAVCGYMPSRLEMHSSLIVFGNAARVGSEVIEARLIDVAPTIAGILGFTIRDQEGTPISALIKAEFLPPPGAEPRKPARNTSAAH